MTKKNCNHDWVYKPGEEPRQKRICRKCGLKQRQGRTETDKYFNSVFAAPPSEQWKPNEEIIKEWDSK